MAERYGTDLTALGGYEGGVNSEQGAALVSTSSAGETALLFGPAALREIQAGVANGDFAIAPDDSTGTITAENPLPYWTFTDVNSAGAITCAIVPDTGVGSGNLLKFSVASGTLTGKSATLTRYIPVASSASRSFSYYLEASFLNGSAAPEGTEATVQVSGQFYEQDQTTTTGSAFVGAAETFSFFASPSASGIVAPDFYAATPDLDNTTVPAAAAFLKVTVTIATVATQTATNEISLTEVRATNGLPELLLTDRTQPDIHGPALITADFGELGLRSGSGDGTIDLGADTNIFGADSVNINTSGDVSINAETGVFITQSSGTVAGRLNSGSLRLSDTTDASLSSTGHAFQIGASSGQNLRIDGNEIMVVNNGGTAAMFLQGDGGTLGIGGNTEIDGNLTVNVSGVEALTLDGFIAVDRAAAGNTVFQSKIPADSANRFLVETDGTLNWGSGSATRDTNLYRSAANALKTDDDLYVVGFINVTGSSTFANNVSAANINLSGANGLRHDEPATTTSTASAAIWVTVSGTNRQLRRNSSSARYKTNIVDADEVVLEAARKVKPRHYESTIEAEAGATRLGFIAEEIHEAGLTHAVGYDADGKPETLDPVALIAALWHRVNDLESRLRELEK
jgi:hypothetical protein